MKTGRGLDDLMNHLFASAETLANPDLKEEELDLEIKRSKILIPTAKTILDGASLALDAAKFKHEYMQENETPALPNIFTGTAKPKRLNHDQEK